jgi:hypothetical protein
MKKFILIATLYVINCAADNVGKQITKHQIEIKEATE